MWGLGPCRIAALAASRAVVRRVGSASSAVALDSSSGSIASTATVHPSAQIAASAVIGPYCTVGPETIVEAGVVLAPHAYIHGFTTLRSGVHVYPYACIGGPPQDLKYRGEPSRVLIGEGTVIREHATIHRGTAARGLTELSARVLVMTAVHVAHDCVVEAGAILSSGCQLAGHVVVGERAIIGGQAAVHQFSHIGAGAMIGGLAAVRGHVAPFCLAKGNTARLAGLNLIGLRRRGRSNAHIRALQAVFDFLFERRSSATFGLGGEGCDGPTIALRAAALMEVLDAAGGTRFEAPVAADARAVASFLLQARRRSALCLP